MVVHINAGAAALRLVLVIGPRRGWREDDAPAQPDTDAARRGDALVRLVRLQRRLGARGQRHRRHAFVTTQVAAAAAAGGLAAVEWWRRQAHHPGRGLRRGRRAGRDHALRVRRRWRRSRSAGGGRRLLFAVGLKFRLGYDDSLDVVGVHMVGGAFGALSLGFLAAYPLLAGQRKGLFYGGGIEQLGVQAVGPVAVGLYSFTVAWIIGKVIDKTMGFRSPRRTRSPASTSRSTPRPPTTSAASTPATPPCPVRDRKRQPGTWDRSPGHGNPTGPALRPRRHQRWPAGWLTALWLGPRGQALCLRRAPTAFQRRAPARSRAWSVDRVVRLDAGVMQRPVEVEPVLGEHDREVPPHRAEPLVPERAVDAGELRAVKPDPLVQAGRVRQGVLRAAGGRSRAGCRRRRGARSISPGRHAASGRWAGASPAGPGPGRGTAPAPPRPAPCWYGRPAAARSGRGCAACAGRCAAAGPGRAAGTSRSRRTAHPSRPRTGLP